MTRLTAASSPSPHSSGVPLAKRPGKSLTHVDSESEYKQTESDQSDHQQEQPSIVRGRKRVAPSGFCEQLRTALKHSQPYREVEGVILNALNFFPRIGRAVQSHINAVSLMQRIRLKKPINLRSVVGTLLSSPMVHKQVTCTELQDLQSAGGISNYKKKSYTANPEDPNQTHPGGWLQTWKPMLLSAGLNTPRYHIIAREHGH